MSELANTTTPITATINCNMGDLLEDSLNKIITNTGQIALIKVITALYRMMSKPDADCL